MQGAVQAEYEDATTDVGVTGVLSVPLPAAHFSMTKIPCPPLVSTKATCEPFSEINGEVRIWPPVLKAQ
jgi:hypothetical protein